jgi:hypothetical protein
MSIPQSELENLEELLQSENIELLRDSAAFFVARCIAQYDGR